VAWNYSPTWKSELPRYGAGCTLKLRYSWRNRRKTMGKQQERQLQQTIVENLLVPMWRGLSQEYKSNYRSNIWEQFTTNIRTAARTDNLAEWYTKVCNRLPVTIRVTDSVSVERVLTSDDEEAILHQLRKKTDLLVVMLQVINEERKAEWKSEQNHQKGTTYDTDPSPLF
jgi:hypothetical protein